MCIDCIDIDILTYTYIYIYIYIYIYVMYMYICIYTYTYIHSGRPKTLFSVGPGYKLHGTIYGIFTEPIRTRVSG